MSAYRLVAKDPGGSIYPEIFLPEAASPDDALRRLPETIRHNYTARPMKASVAASIVRRMRSPGAP